MPELLSRLYTSLWLSFKRWDSLLMQYVTNSRVFLSIVHKMGCEELNMGLIGVGGGNAKLIDNFVTQE